MDALLTSMAYGLDSFVLCIGLGSLSHPQRTWILLAAAFGLADGGAALLGEAIAGDWPTLPPLIAFISPVLVATYGGLVLLATARIRAIMASRSSIFALPILMSLDNLFGGADGGLAKVSPVTQAGLMALTTGAMALTGCCLGGWLVGRWPRLTRPLVGSATLASALVMSLT